MPELIDYPAELEQLAAQLAHPATPRDISYPIGGRILREAAALLRLQESALSGLCATLDRVAREKNEALAVLVELEWSVRAEGMEDVDDNPYWNFCPMCARVQADGHATDCRLKATLDGR